MSQHLFQVFLRAFLPEWREDQKSKLPTLLGLLGSNSVLSLNSREDEALFDSFQFTQFAKILPVSYMYAVMYFLEKSPRLREMR